MRPQVRSVSRVFISGVGAGNCRLRWSSLSYATGYGEVSAERALRHAAGRRRGYHPIHLMCVATSGQLVSGAAERGNLAVDFAAIRRRVDTAEAAEQMRLLARLPEPQPTVSEVKGLRLAGWPDARADEEASR